MTKEYIVVLPSGTRTGNVTSNDFSSENGTGGIFTVDVKSIVAGSVTMTIQGKDRISSKYNDILTSTALIAAGTRVLTVYPGAAASNNVTASQPLPLDWRVSIVSASGTATYTVGASLV